MHSQIDGIHRPLLHIWYTIGVSDKGAFNITLASALFHQNLFLGKKDADGPESTMYYTNSIQSMTQRLQDPRESTSDGVVGTILGLSCYDVCPMSQQSRKVLTFPAVNGQASKMEGSHGWLAKSAPSTGRDPNDRL